MAKPKRVVVKGKKKKTGKIKMRVADPAPKKWLALLADPCAADLAYPCYAGSDAGYVVRTVDSVSLAFSGSFTVGQSIIGDGVLTYTPWNISATTGIWQYAVGSGGIMYPVETGRSNFISDNAAVRAYRPVACCLKWVPTGPIGGRSGCVATSYVPGAGPTASAQVDHWVALAQRKAGNGTEMHEVNWVPTARDEEFTTLGELSTFGSGTVFIALKGVDATATSTTNAVLNGFMEITTVWEWTPALAAGISTDARKPSPYTSQSVLSMVRDLKDIIYAGASNMAAQMGGSALAYASRTFMGVTNLGGSMRQPSIPLLRY